MVAPVGLQNISHEVCENKIILVMLRVSKFANIKKNRVDSGVSV